MSCSFGIGNARIWIWTSILHIYLEVCTGTLRTTFMWTPFSLLKGGRRPHFTSTHLIAFAIWLADIFPNLASWSSKEEWDDEYREFVAWAVTVRLLGFRMLTYMDDLPRMRRRRFLPIFAAEYHRRTRTNGYRKLAICILGFWLQFGNFMGNYTGPLFRISRSGRRIDLTLTTSYDGTTTICLHFGSEAPKWTIDGTGQYVRLPARRVWGVSCYDSVHFVYLARYLSRRFPRLASYETTEEHYSGHYIAKARVLGLSRNQFM